MDDQATSIWPAREQRPLVLCVIKVREGSDLRVGQVFETRSTPLLIGRDARADVRLNDRTVSASGTFEPTVTRSGSSTCRRAARRW